MKTIISTMTCSKNKKQQDIFTYLHRDQVTDDIQIVFYQGGNKYDYQNLPIPIFTFVCEDGYERTSLKKQLFFQNILNSQFDYLFHIDDDTYVRADRLNNLPKEDYVGTFNSEWKHNVKYGGGGAGYLLSRKAVECYANHDIAARGGCDVVMAEVLNKNNIHLTETNLLNQLYENIPQPTNQFISCHYVNTIERMNEIKSYWSNYV